MSSQLHDGESDRQKQVKLRADESLVEEYDEVVEKSDEYNSRSEAIRAHMRRASGSDEWTTPRQPPTDNEGLREGYTTLCRIANSDGIISHELATAELSTTLGLSQTAIERAVLRKLRQRGYISQKTNWTGSNQVWKLRGIDDE